MNKTVKPFVKWAGGKSQLLQDIRTKYPLKIDRYCEPFVGGGAVLFDVLATHHPKEVLINDINQNLITTYIQIRDDVKTLISALSSLQNEFWSKDTDARKQMYLAKRDEFNNLIKSNKKDNLLISALFIFLNRTCFNGLYRVNSKGLFNVPMGDYKKPLICDADNLREISTLLQGVNITCGDYKNSTDFIDKNTFVYIDPPYRPLTKTASFTSYSETEFGDKQQIELSNFVNNISQKGAMVLLSNSDPKNTDENDSFFDELYKGYAILRVSAKRMINSKATGRGFINELLICNKLY